MADTRRVRLKDIAERLGLSVNTVSRALADKDSVGETTRERVRAEAERLGYVPNSMARSLVLQTAMTFGVVITNPSNPFYAQLISAIEQRVRLYGYSLMLLVTEENADTDRAAAQTLLRWGVDGALVVPVQDTADHWRRLAASVPVVLLNRDLSGLDVDFVGIDHEQGAYEATTHVLEAGSRDPCLVEEDLPISSVLDRHRGFQRAMAEHGVRAQTDRVTAVPTSRHDASALPWDPTASYEIATELVRGPSCPDAVITGNDYFALGFYRAMDEAGLRAPEDLLVSGYGDHPFAAYVTPALTTVRLPAAEVGASAVDLLLRRVKERGEHEPTQHTRLRPELCARMSTVGR